MLLEDFVSLYNLTAVFTLDKPADQHALVLILTRFSILLLGADALTPTIIKRVWGANAVVRCNLGGSHGNLAIIHATLSCWLVLPSTPTISGSPPLLMVAPSSHPTFFNTFHLAYMTSYTSS
jgi:hypothetical protein